MKIYRVGGSVRDQFLGLMPKDVDFVVVGGTPQQMLALGYKQVGKEFPVFLDQLGNEYALARKEKKTGPGYRGFETTHDSSVTLEEDLQRRDLTINAIAFDGETGRYIDPFDGRKDLDIGVLRHVSDAFGEDPVRILRTCRFAARYGFFIAPETIRLMTDMVDSGEIDHLVPERVWLEMNKAMMERTPLLFFQNLEISGATNKLFPYLSGIGRDQPLQTRMSKAVFEGLDSYKRFAILTHHLDDESIENFYERWQAPIIFSTFAIAFKHIFNSLFSVIDIEPNWAHEIFEELDLYRRKGLLADIVSMINITDSGSEFARKANKLLEMYEIASETGFMDLDVDTQMTFKGKAIGAAIDALRVSNMRVWYELNEATR